MDSSQAEDHPLCLDSWQDEKGRSTEGSISGSIDESLSSNIKPFSLTTSEHELEKLASGKSCRKLVIFIVLFMAAAAVIIPKKLSSSNDLSTQDIDNSSAGQDNLEPSAQDTLEPPASYSEEQQPNDQDNDPFVRGPLPFSTLDPVQDLDLFSFERPLDSSPSHRLDPLREKTKALPTSSWYLNLLLLREDEEPNINHRAYAVPYVVDVAGPIAGLRIHSFERVVTSTAVTLAVNEPRALTLGAAVDFQKQELDTSVGKGYSVVSATNLGVTLKWDYVAMKSSIVRGMPYATMVYESLGELKNEQSILPTLHSSIGFREQPIADGLEQVDCSKGVSFQVKREMKLSFQSGLEWMVFFSQPVTVKCLEEGSGGPFLLQVLGTDGGTDLPLVLRVAMIVPSYNEQDGADDFSSSYEGLLRRHSAAYPGDATAVDYSVDKDKTLGTLSFDWDVQYVNETAEAESLDLLMFALPHHQDLLDTETDTCTTSLLGPTCLVEGNSWTMVEELPKVTYQAPRHPEPEFISVLADALNDDLDYAIPDNFLIGAGDTYFSGKALAKLARILLVADEIQSLCSTDPTRVLKASVDEYRDACSNSTIPSDERTTAALDQLRRGVEVWISGKAQSPFVYDPAWGGVVNCGCYYEDGKCSNKFPDCPAFTDHGLNFGNGIYNDHHFHYGYHIYAAAILSHFDEIWAKENFEKVLLLVRDFANPSLGDEWFPVVRHKDWFQGSSWASGMAQPPVPNGMNQESSSEAIAAYEAVALFGSTMISIFWESGDAAKAIVADEIHTVGLMLTATELRSAKRYWQVTHSNESKRIFPSTYEPNVVGILWTTMAQYGTWFGNDPFLIYGIQLLPLTPIAEARDDLEWAMEMFDPFAKTCDASCASGGWSVQVLAILATIGHKDLAIEQAKRLPSAVFETSGGNGHSKSNTLWYLSTRPTVEEPFSLADDYPWDEYDLEIRCHQPSTCTDDVLDTLAGGIPCRSRIQWLMNDNGQSQWNACKQVAHVEFPSDCGACNPHGSPPENVEQLDSDLSCYQPTLCTDDVLGSMAGEYPCRDRIQFLVDAQELSRWDACAQVSVGEFPRVCGPCNPAGLQSP